MEGRGVKHMLTKHVTKHSTNDLLRLYVATCRVRKVYFSKNTPVGGTLTDFTGLSTVSGYSFLLIAWELDEGPAPSPVFEVDMGEFFFVFSFVCLSRFTGTIFYLIINSPWVYLLYICIRLHILFIVIITSSLLKKFEKFYSSYVISSLCINLGKVQTG